jgi:hypothetical protein
MDANHAISDYVVVVGVLPIFVSNLLGVKPRRRMHVLRPIKQFRR